MIQADLDNDFALEDIIFEMAGIHDDDNVDVTENLSLNDESSNEDKDKESKQSSAVAEVTEYETNLAIYSGVLSLIVEKSSKNTSSIVKAIAVLKSLNETID